jgi:hypothetical protein
MVKSFLYQGFASACLWMIALPAQQVNNKMMEKTARWAALSNAVLRVVF